MKYKHYDLVGKRYGRLVIERMWRDGKSYRCECICDCGNKSIVYLSNLLKGSTKSCGCYNREITRGSVKVDYERAYERLEAGEIVGVVAKDIGISRQSLSRHYNRWLREKWLRESGIIE